jgi:N-acetylglucosaminyldiphosphoundecaprenol N-acetyl-beta-D-mannosaminyltransferase
VVVGRTGDFGRSGHERRHERHGGSRGAREMKTIQVLSVSIAALTRDGFKEEVVARLRGQHPVAIAKVNAEFLLRTLDDGEFREFLGSTSLNIADGAGVLWAARFLTLRTARPRVINWVHVLWQAAYSLSSLVLRPSFCRTPIPERIPGVDALFTMLEAAQEAGASVFFLGAGPQINSKARAEMQAHFPGLAIAGGRDGYTEDWSSAIQEINASKAAMVVVALGSPKQEYWIRDHLHELSNVRVAVGEGGSLDFIAGDFRRAPKCLQALGLEWSWRLFMNPNKTGSMSRARRIWRAVPVFVYRTVRWKLKHGTVAVDGRTPA